METMKRLAIALLFVLVIAIPATAAGDGDVPSVEQIEDWCNRFVETEYRGALNESPYLGLLVGTCALGYLAGYRHGVERGYRITELE
jgi:hypothetical protein